MGTLREQLQEIYDQRQALTPQILVEVARPADHPLHHQFEWDDSIAAEQYRLRQAGDLIRSIKVSRMLGEGPVQIRAFLPRRGGDDGAGVYAPTEEVLADPFTAAILLREFEREWKALYRRYGHLKEFASVVQRDLGAA